MVQYFLSFFLGSCAVLLVVFGSVPAAWGAELDGNDAATVHGLYRLVFEQEGDKAFHPREQRWLQQVHSVWRSGSLIFSSLWEAPIGRFSPAALGSERSQWQGRLDWLPESGTSRAAGSRSPRIALGGAGLLFRERPLASGDAFRLFHPAADQDWGHAAYVVVNRTGAMALGRGKQLGRWWATYHRAWGAAAGRGIAWGQWRWEPTDSVRWRFTTVNGDGRLEPPPGARVGPGVDPYRAWSVDGLWRREWGDVEGGYAQRADEEGGGYRAAGFLRAQTHRRGPSSAVLELHRRDEGFRIPRGGDLRWREGTVGVLGRLRRQVGRWEGQWERRWERDVESKAAGSDSRWEDALRLTWRPGGSWWARLEQTVPSDRSEHDYIAYVRWPRSSFTAQARFTREGMEERWRWRLDWYPGPQRLRIDWDTHLTGWRVEYRQEWANVGLRMVYKQRNRPPYEDERQYFSFIQATYGLSERWQVTATVGWDDRGRIDFHWDRPPRWELAWQVFF